MSFAIEATHVVKRFARATILEDMSLAVRPSEIACLIGPSGCGKSTLLRILSGLERDHAGRVVIDGREVTGPSRAVGFMFQEPRLLPWLTVHDNIVLGLPRAKRRDGSTLVATLLAQVHLEGSERALPRQLSGGMAQRVALARALATEPSVLLLDEPFSAVDALTRMSLQELVLAIWQRTRITMLLVTHDLDEALYLSDRVFVMSGRPATLTEVIDVDLARPRDRRDPEIARRRVQLMDALHVASVPPSAARGDPR
ncbi:MAG TPA: ABC transporter ATP-binding protein [Kofleriaceae bacterium]|jgi:sulfonate transport system ATP-binding protein|nr:ABC transporter ATP-binding protein [Kofleriaceae bacterium]